MKKDALMIAISMLIFGTVGAFKRFIPVSAGELALYRAVLATVVIGLVLLLFKKPIPFGRIKKQLPLLFVSGAAMGINWILLFKAYEYTTVSAATLSYYFAPVIVTLLCPVLFKEKMTAKQIICFVVSTLGLVLITGLKGGAGDHLTGILFGLSAAVFYASVVLLNKFIKGVDGLHRTLLQFVAAIIVLAPYVALSGGTHLVGMPTSGWVNLLIVGVVHTGLCYCLYFSALKTVPGQKAAILSYIDPLVAVLVSVTFLHEPMGLAQWIGGAMILGATLYNEIGPRK